MLHDKVSNSSRKFWREYEQRKWEFAVASYERLKRLLELTRDPQVIEKIQARITEYEVQYPQLKGK